MKKTLAVIAILAAALGAVSWFLQKAVDRKLAEALPEASRKTGLPMTAGTLDMNVLSGRGEIRDLAIGSPEGFPDVPLFTLAEGRISVRYRPLLAGRVRLGEVAVREAELTIVRTADGQLNLKPRKPKAAPGPGGSDAPKPQAPPAEEGKLPDIGIDDLAAKLTVLYRDYGFTSKDKPYEARFRLDLTGANLATYGEAADESAWGPFKADGFVESEGHSAPVHLEGRLAPLADPGSPSFRLKGTFGQLDPAMIRPLLGDAKVQGEAESLEMELLVVNGRFDESQSKLTLALKNVRYGKNAIPDVTLAIPVHGSIGKPRLRVEQALLGLLGQVLAAPPSGDDGQGKKKRNKGLDVEAISKGLESLFK